MKKIAVLTSGGDSPGMNACIANLHTLCMRKNIELVGFKEGYVGLVNNLFFPITKEQVKNIYNLGGSILKTGRSKEFLTKEGQLKAVNNLKNNQIDALVVIGGNGSYRGAQELSAYDIPIICLPGTIDNDLDYTEKSLGFDTAVNNSVSALDKIKDTMASNSRGVVVEVMGRRSGDIALYTATASNADALVVKEVEETKHAVVNSIKQAINRGVESPTVVVAENIVDVSALAAELEQKTGVVFKPMVLGYIQRGGNPTVFDRNFAMELAVKTIELLEENKTNRAIGLKNGKIYDVELKTVLTHKDNFNFELYHLFEKLNG
jgi:6-phosphofructokinase 1